MKVYSTMNPLPIGTCAAVRLEIRDPKTRDIPRNPSGKYVTITDFDMSVTADGGAVAAQWQDPYHLLACGCQRGTAGSSAVVTAKYPARALAQASRVPGVSVEAAGNFSLARALSASDPPSCAVQSAAAAIPGTGATPITGVTRPQAGTIARSPTPAPAPASPASAPTAVTASSPASGTPLAPVAKQPVGGKTPVSTEVVSGPLPVAPTGGKVRMPPPAAPRPVVPINPSGFTAQETSQGVVRLSWQPVSGASYYVLLGPGLPLGGVKVGLGKSGVPQIVHTATGVRHGNQEWAVASYYDPGPVSTPAAAFPRVTLNVSPPVPVNPSGLAAVQTATGQVRLSWQPVDDVSYYMVTGPGSTDGGVRVDAATSGFGASDGKTVIQSDVVLAVTQVPGGNHEWSVGSYYDPGPISSAETSFPRVSLNVTPPINPSGFAAVQVAPGQVRLSWKPVSGVSYYIVTGSGLGLDGTRVSPPAFGASGAGGTVAEPDLEFIVNAVGLSTWQVGSYFDPGPLSTPFNDFPRITFFVTGPAK
ncbi:MAG TPA: hypothetical protein VES88_10530 [Gemmatimonadaceae bacterium]|nr:hypothetical protein [Gemmatimonadaceae bacterium]